MERFTKKIRNWFGASHNITEKSGNVSDYFRIHGVGEASWGDRSYSALAQSGYAENVVANRCVRLISEGAATVPICLKEDGYKIHTHPVLSVLRAPNGHTASGTFWSTLYAHLQTSGNAFIHGTFLENEIRGLHLLRPDRVRVMTDDKGWPDSYVYEVNGRHVRYTQDIHQQRFPILHLKIFHPLNDQYGLSPLAVAGNAIDLHNAATGWNKALLDNAARPSGALIFKGQDGITHLTSDQFERLKSELSQTYGGSENAGRPLVLEGGLDWKPMSLSPADMDFMNAKHSAARDIALAFGVPPMLLGLPGDNTYSNYKEANLAFWHQTILPLIETVTSALTRWLFTQEDSMQLTYDAAQVEALSLERHAKLQKLLSSEVLTVAEKRVALGYPAQPQEDKR